MSESKGGGVIRDTVGATAGVVFGALAAATGHGPELAAGAGIVGQTLALLGWDSVTRRSEPFVSAYRRELLEHNTGDFDEQVRERAKDPQFRAVMYQALRKVRDTYDDAVVPALGVLTADYTVPAAKVPDAFFRGASDLLCELTAEEYAALVRLADEIAKTDDSGSTYIAIATASQAPDKIKITVGVSSQSVPTMTRTVEFRADACTTLATRLVRHGLARNVPTPPGAFLYEGSTEAVSWSAIVHIDPKAARRLHSVLSRAAVAEVAGVEG